MAFNIRSCFDNKTTYSLVGSGTFFGGHVGQCFCIFHIENPNSCLVTAGINDGCMRLCAYSNSSGSCY